MTNDFRRDMRSKQLNLSAYDTDKIKLRYLEVYDPILVPWIGKAITLLEIGVYRGGSLKLWCDYFPRGAVVGIDRKLPQHFQLGERIRIFEGSQADKKFLSKVANATAPDGFDIIIDDASHIGELTKTTFWHLFDHHLKPGGLYAIEDWGTGYLDDFSDGKKFDPKSSILGRVRSVLPRRFSRRMKVPVPCHSFGMVGFIKELVDEQGAASIAMGHKGSWRTSRFKNLLITPGIVFVTKAAPTLTAFPNPVPVRNRVGKTTISWNTAITAVGKVYVSIDNRQELLFASPNQGSAAANWIRAGSTYEFRLYDSDHTRLLDKIIVTTTQE
jgi:hypothetical protein